MRHTRTCRAERAGMRGFALAVVMMLSAALLAIGAATFDLVKATLRVTGNLSQRVQAFHAADAALSMCERRIAAGNLDALPAASAGEPREWRRQARFDDAASAARHVAQRWPAAATPPQCLIEQWLVAGSPGTRRYLITARGFGVRPDDQAWLQAIVTQDAAGRIVARWRSVAARPF